MGPVLLATMLLAQTGEAQTCDCVPAPGPEARLGRAEAAFYATAVHGGWLGRDTIFTDFEVERGPLADQLRLEPDQTRIRVRHSSDVGGPGCGVRFELLGRYLVLVSQSRVDAQWETSACLMPAGDGSDGIEAAFDRAQTQALEAGSAAELLQDIELGRTPPASADMTGAVDVEGRADG